MAEEQDSFGKNALMYASICSRLLHALSFYSPGQISQPGGGHEAAATPDNKPSERPTEFLHISFTKQLLALPSARAQALAVDNEGRNALMHAITYYGVENALELLLLPSADEQAGMRDNQGRNAMMLAVMHRKMTVFGRLLDLPSGKAQLQAADSQGRNAIDYIQKHFDADVQENLLAAADAVLNPRTE